MAIYITGDLHGPRGLSRLDYYFDMVNALGKSDYLIILGDFGLIWDGSLSEDLALEDLCTRPYTTLFLDGNHENFSLLNSFPVETWHGGKIHRIKDSIFHLMRGQIFTIDGKTFFAMGGAKSIDITHRQAGISWWKEEIPSGEEFEEAIHNLKQNDNQVDFILTHTCSSEMHEDIEEYIPLIAVSDPVCKFLQRLEDEVRFNHWYFGHFHLDCLNIYPKHSALYEKIIMINTKSNVSSEKK